MKLIECIFAVPEEVVQQKETKIAFRTSGINFTNEEG
jgi:hypothetical protein